MPRMKLFGKIPLIVIAGPTSSGKSNLAIALAREYNGEIISADSRQVYRGMDLGTGKVTRREQRLVSHWMLDIASPKRQYDVAQWRRGAQRAIADIARRGKIPIICGGTGFWIDALVYDIVLPNVKPNAKLRAKLERYSTEKLFALLVSHDQSRAKTIDRHNKRRLIRALEIIKATGKQIPQIKISPSRQYDVIYIGISVPMETLKIRIAKRLHARLKRGMVAEAQRLHRQGVSWKRMESFGLEYKYLALFLQQKISRPAMEAGIIRDSIRYAKRQLTWWHANKDIQWITSIFAAQRLTNSLLTPHSAPSLPSISHRNR